MKSLDQWACSQNLELMSEILKLPAEVSTKVAAGEVVEKPYNIVKELVENSLDADAKNISVEIAEGGLSLVKVIDDGKGILPEDLPLTVERFATSKISQVDDIFSLTTFGFRGEAMAAISSVSRFSVKTYRQGSKPVELITDYGAEQVIKPSAPIPGTTVTVQDVFKNVPARLKFFNSPSASEREISKFIKQMSLLHPDVKFKLKINGKENYSSKSGIDEIFKEVFNTSDFITGCCEYGDMKMSFASTTPIIQRMRKDAIVIGVNGRLVKDNSLVQAVVQAYHRMMPDNRYPSAIVSLYINPGSVDANIHPAKITVNILNKRDAFSFVYDSIRKTLENPSNEKPEKRGEENYFEKVKEEASLYKPTFNISEHLETQHSSVKQEFQRPAARKESEYNDEYEYRANYEDTPKRYVVKGQLFDSVIVAESNDKNAFFIDQHVAHERILYERFKKNKEMGLATVALFEPVVIEPEGEMADILEQELAAFEKFGYGIEEFGSGCFKIFRVPVDTVNRNIEKTVLEILKDMADLKKSKTEDYKIVSMACKAAVKAGERLTMPEMQNIVDELFECSNPHTCPHGRPIIFTLSEEYFFRKFGR